MAVLFASAGMASALATPAAAERLSPPRGCVFDFDKAHPERQGHCFLADKTGVIIGWQYFDSSGQPIPGDVGKDTRGLRFDDVFPSAGGQQSVQQVATPTAPGAGPYGGLQHKPTSEAIVTQTPNGVYAASYQKNYFWEETAADGVGAVVDAAAQRLFCGKGGCGGSYRYNYGYGRTYDSGYRTSYGYRSCPSMGPGYTGPIIPCN